MIKLANMVPTMTNWTGTRRGSYRLVVQAMFVQSSHKASSNSVFCPATGKAISRLAVSPSASRCDARVSANTNTRSKKSSRNVARAGSAAPPRSS